MVIICKMNPNQILREFLYKNSVGGYDYERPTYLPIKKVSLIYLKFGTLKVYDE